MTQSGLSYPEPHTLDEAEPIVRALIDGVRMNNRERAALAIVLDYAGRRASTRLLQPSEEDE